MAPSTKPALVLGSASLCATLAVILAGAQQPDCSFFDWMFPAIAALQLCFALAAGFATGYRRPHNREPVRAGLGTSLIASLSGLVLYVGGMGLLPATCGETARALGVFFLASILLFFVAPVAIVGGAAAGWLGGQLARTNTGRIALACTLTGGLALCLLLLLHQPFNSGVRGIVKVPLCPYIPVNGCVLEPSAANITVHMPHSEQVVTMTSSDEQGRYQIALAPGKYEISAERYGFTTGAQAITINANSYITLELDTK